MEKEHIELKIDRRLDIRLEKLENSLSDKFDKKFKNLYWLVSIYVIVFTAFYSFLFFFVYDQYNERFSKLEVASFTTTKDVILDEIREIKQEMKAVGASPNEQRASYMRHKKQKPVFVRGQKRKINNVQKSRDISSVPY